MGFIVPDKKKSISQNLYPIEGLSKKYSIPFTQYLPGRIAERMQGAVNESIYVILDELAPGLGEELRDYPLQVVTDLIADWQKASSASVGE